MHFYVKRRPYLVTALATRAALRAISIPFCGEDDEPAAIFNILPQCCSGSARLSTCSRECELTREKIKELCRQVTAEEVGSKKRSVCHAVDAGIVATSHLFGDNMYILLHFHIK